MPLINHEIAQKQSLYNDLFIESRKKTHLECGKLLKNDILFFNWNSDNHGQKSWDKFTFVALLHTRQTNSSTLVHPLPLSPLLQCWTRVQAISPKFQHCIGGRGGRQHILKRITVLFENSILKTPKMNAITQVSQGILSTIVWISRLIVKCTITMFFLALNAFGTRDCEHLSLERHFYELLHGFPVYFERFWTRRERCWSHII